MCEGAIRPFAPKPLLSAGAGIYHHDLEPNASLFATRKACEPVHLQLNEKTWAVQVINNLGRPLNGARARLTLYNLDGTKSYQRDFDVNAAPSHATDLPPVEWPANLSPVHFVKLELLNQAGESLSDNFYWRAPRHPDDLQDLGTMPKVTLALKAARRVQSGMVWVNGVGNHFKGTPYGGLKNSGIGKESCLSELLSYTEEKSIQIFL